MLLNARVDDIRAMERAGFVKKDARGTIFAFRENVYLQRWRFLQAGQVEKGRISAECWCEAAETSTT